MFRGVPVVLLAFLVSASFLGGGITHAITPHDHGHSHGGEMPAIWQDLHAAFRHDEKIDFVVSATQLTLFSVLALVLVEGFRPRRFVLAEVLDPSRGEKLRRGIIPYRRFG